MKRMLACFLAALFVLAALPQQMAAASPSVRRADSTATLPSGGTRAVIAVKVDLADPNIRIFSMHAGDGVGDTASLKDIAASIDQSRYEALAAINGTFFDAYVDGPKRGMGTVVEQGRMIYKVDGAFIGFGLDNSVMLDWVHVECIGWTGGVKDNLHSFYIHQWNRLLPAGASYREGILTPDFGTSTGKTDMNVLVVRNGVITGKNRGDTAIPKDGFVYVYPDTSPYNDGRFQVGACFEYQRKFYNKAKQEVDWNSMHSMTGVGPTLMLRGKKTADAASEGWTDPKLTQSAGQRSLIGYDAARKTLTLATVPNSTITQLGDVAASLGLYDAMNLDGGASSGLLFGQSYLTAPGRALSNAIVVVRIRQQPTSLWSRESIARGISMRYIPQDLQSGYQNPVTREEYCRAIMAMLRAVTLKGNRELVSHFGAANAYGGFTDVTRNQDDIFAANTLGIVSGVGGGRFDPAGIVNRAQAATMLSNALRIMKVPVPEIAVRYDDHASIPIWAEQGVQAAYATGLMTGSGNVFDPLGRLTREQCFAVVYRLAGFVPDVHKK
ncbi:MAG: hypothetical protein ABT01_03880 [Clostridium sp. SCN 57-10]|nr:MAG: hypothetical protein ABT01_03880 [Clostridium sp. SCN 57-10]